MPKRVSIQQAGRGKNSIGRFNERTLHEEIKRLYVNAGSKSEVELDGFIIDVVTKGNRLIEIQTSDFSKIKHKLDILLRNHSVKLVYPLAIEKSLLVYDGTGHRLLYRRKSPKKRTVLDIVDEIIRIPTAIMHPHFELEVLCTRVEEIRKKDGNGSWRRKGISIVDRRMLAVEKTYRFCKPEDYLDLLPRDCPILFTNKELSILLGVDGRQAQKLTYCLKSLRLLQVHGKKGNEQIFTLAGGAGPTTVNA